MKGNKGLTRYFGLILGFGIVFIIIFFMAIFLSDIGRTEILDTIDNFANESETQLGISTEMSNHIHSLPEEYSNTSIPYDLFFVVAFIIMYSTALYGAYTAPEKSMFGFFGFVFMGMIGLLFVSGIVNLVVNWFILNLVQGFVGFDLSQTPIIYFYLSNLTIVNFALGLILVLVNKLNFTTQREEEDTLINSEISRFRGGGE